MKLLIVESPAKCKKIEQYLMNILEELHYFLQMYLKKLMVTLTNIGDGDMKMMI